MTANRMTRRGLLRNAGVIASSAGIASASTGASTNEQTGIVKSVQSFDNPVTSEQIHYNRDKALRKFVEFGGNRPEGYGYGHPPEGSKDVIAHVVMYDADRGFREFIGRGASSRDDVHVRQSATQFRDKIAGTQRVTSLESSSNSSSGDEEWRTLSDSRWLYEKDPCGKVEVPYKWRRVDNDGSSSYDIFGLRTDVRFIPGYIAYNSAYRNNYHAIRHFKTDDGFRYIEDYSPEGMTFGNSSVTANLGWNTAYWSWSYTTPDVSIEQNGDTTVGELDWDIPNNNGDDISGNARDSTLTWEPGSRWRWDQQSCKGEVKYLRNVIYCQFNQDGTFVDGDCDFSKFHDFWYTAGHPNLC